MRVIARYALPISIAAAFIAGCGGPDDPAASMAAACERQIEEVEAEAGEGNTPTAESTEERLSEITLVECAGQDISVAAGDAESAEGDEGDAESDEETDEADTDEAAEETDEAPAELDPEARSLFAETCGGCHTLSDAGTSGAVGPVLDDTEVDAEGIEGIIENGRGAMPPGLLEGDDATSVAEYVASAAAAG